VSPALVSAVVDATLRHGAAIPVVPVAETLKRVAGERVTGTVDRAGLRLAQTPQGVRRGLLRRAFAALPANLDRELTDEAALLEACNIPVHVVAGDPMNLKVTVAADLRLADAALAGSPRTRIGFGSDRHSFGPGAPLRLGGVEIAGAARLHGHSDGDVALHAVANALLGAAALGDLGGMFPADERTSRGAASRALLEVVVGRVAEAGWRPSAVDVVIEGARPRLAGHLEAMRGAIAALLGLDGTAVGVTASTGNLAGSDGAGRSISATAIATLERATGR
jgi:2-C-methyl-D-erythritol 2,4-cyclodiphosphate synthase